MKAFIVFPSLKSYQPHLVTQNTTFLNIVTGAISKMRYPGIGWFPNSIRLVFLPEDSCVQRDMREQQVIIKTVFEVVQLKTKKCLRFLGNHPKVEKVKKRFL